MRLSLPPGVGRCTSSNHPGRRGRRFRKESIPGSEKLKAKGEGSFFIASRMEEIPWEEIAIAVEAVPEKLEIKQEVFAKMEGLSRAGIPLTSNSSGFPISEIGKELKTRSRMLGLHFFMPAHLAPLVEVVCSEATDPRLAEDVCSLMKRLGKKPVLVKKDIPGFLANRIQHALMREALSLVEQGIATPEDVDDAVRYGFGFRYIAAGTAPSKRFDRRGYPVFGRRHHLPRSLQRFLPESVPSRKKWPPAIWESRPKRGFTTGRIKEIAEFKENYEKALLKALEIMRE